MNIYLDNNIATKMAPEVFETMRPYFTEHYGLAEGLHQASIDTHQGIQKAIGQIYNALGAKDSDTIYLTSGQNESNTTLINSVYNSIIRKSDKNHVITTEVEHPSILKTLHYLETEHGIEVTYLPINDNGLVEAHTIKSFITKKTALITTMVANQSSGAILPVKEIAQIAKENDVIYHVDATYAIGKMILNVQELGVDYLTIDGSVLHGAKGSGALFVKDGRKLEPLFIVPNPINTPSLVSFGKACEMAIAFLGVTNTRVRKLRDKLQNALLDLDDILVVANHEQRVPNLLTFIAKDANSESILFDLNNDGIFASLQPLNIKHYEATLGVSFSLSRYNTEDEIDVVIDSLIRSIKRLRQIAPKNIV